MEKNGREIDSKRMWTKVISESYGLKKLQHKGKMWEKWYDLHNFGRKEIVDEMINIHEDDIILDIGCGDGSLLTRFENKCKLTIGIDIKDHFCHNSKINAPQSLIIKGDVEHLPLANNCIGVCSIVFAFVYTSNKVKILKEIHRVLKIGGRLIIFDPNRISLLTFKRRLFNTMHKIRGNKDHIVVTQNILLINRSLTIFKFKNLGIKTGFRCNYWRGNFDAIPFFQINEGFFGKVSLFFFWLWEKSGCKKWGRLPLLRNFCDYIIIEFIKYKR